MEVHNKKMFFVFIKMGKELIDYATKGDLLSFKAMFAAAPDKEIMFWHITKSFKAAVKHQRLNIIESSIWLKS